MKGCQPDEADTSMVAQKQRTRANLSPKAVLVIGEVIAPGRVVYGENFAFDYLEIRLTVIDPTGMPLFHESSVVTLKKFADASDTCIGR